MHSLPQILRCDPRVRVLIVGGYCESGYGGGHPSGKPIRQVLEEELADEIDWSRLHFLGRIPHSHLLGLLCQLGPCLSQLPVCARVERLGSDGVRMLHGWQYWDAGGGGY